MARAHGKPAISHTAGPLRRRFAQARERIYEAYEVLARDAKNHREPSPAEEWLLDNGSVVEEQIREIAEDLPFGYLLELPRLVQGPMRGYPRVYGLCIDYLRHTDVRVDLSTLASFVASYQSVDRLTIGELWAVPIMLRLGLILTVGALAASEAGARDRARGDACAERLLANGSHPEEIDAYLTELEKGSKPLTAAFLVQLLRRLREHDAPLEAARKWVMARCAGMGTTPDELTRREHLRQAADQVSVGNAITSMRAVSAMDWDAFFERTSHVEVVLRRDPVDAYAKCDKATRDRYRHAVEDLARRGREDELTVACRAIELAQAAHAPAALDASLPLPAQAHVGYYLVDDGRKELERSVGYSPRPRVRLVQAILAHPGLFYFATLGLFTLALVLALAQVWTQAEPAGPALWAFALLFAVPASEVALALVNSLVVTVLPPRLLPKLDFQQGIPGAHRTLVVVPVLLDSAATLEQLCADLEVRSLGNPDVHLHFALLTDFVDAEREVTDADLLLLEQAKERIGELNERWGGGVQRYWLLHRRRVHNPTERRYMGWERKRGKLEELNRLLRGDESTTFSFVSAPLGLLRDIRYVITLDADTELPRDVGRKLVAALAHPLNRPLVDTAKQRVVRGHAIIQPRVGILPSSSRRSRFSAIATGVSGIDPYTTAVSDTYQDLFGEGSYVGKGIYDVDAFHGVLLGRVPEDRMLSHDLFEGIYARSALATDIEVLDEQPASYAVQVGRQHRWMRGDWQLVPWLLPRVPAAGGTRPNDLSLLDRWKLIDNLRRSLLAPAVVVLSVISWLWHEHVAGAVLALVAAVFIVPLGARLLLSLLRQSTSSSQPIVGSLGGDLRTNAPQVLLNLVFTLDQAWLSVDAIGRALYRLVVSKRHLLEWTTMQKAAQARRGSKVQARMFVESALSAALLVWVGSESPSSLPMAALLLLPWASTPIVAWWLGRPATTAHPVRELPAADRELLRLTARKTWRFFETFVGEADNYLPPDNYQEDPRGVVAHRTSPTNMGLYLLSVVSARDLHYITLEQAAERLRKSLSTLEGLQKHEGHILNWYDTTSLRPLEPQYVSTVDSGNLAAYLWTLREACVDLGRGPVVSLGLVEAVQDALGLARREAKRDADGEAERNLKALAAQLPPLLEPRPFSLDVLRELRGLARELASSRASAWGQGLGEGAAYWLAQAERSLSEALVELTELVPAFAREEEAFATLRSAPDLREHVERLEVCLAELESPAAMVNRRGAALGSVAELEEALRVAELPADVRGACELELEAISRAVNAGAEACQGVLSLLSDLGARAAALADAMNFRFLFDEQRELFAIGYSVSLARLDTSHYDLLASEARLASLFCIAKGDVPQTHWFRLGRPRARIPGGRALLSWSGSMFEYLMPLLVTRTNPQTLLDEGYHAAVERQREYAASRGVPWGISEGAYNVMDLRMTYQYRAFGVPGLGLKAGLQEDLVIAPYATVLAGLVRPDLVGKNLRALEKQGLDGPYGFYESIDYTPEHVPPGRKGIVVKAFMAHHQGMIMVALDNMLCDAPMQRRFHRDPRIKATELLLEERVPLGAPPMRSPATVMPTAARIEPHIDAVEHVGLRGAGPMRVHLLGHGEVSSLVTATGSGVTTWKGMDVNRFREDPLLDAGGIYLYVRNRTEKRVWSAGYEPTRAEPNFYNVVFSIDRVEFHRKDGDVQTVTEVALSPEHAVEVRRLTLTNQGARALELEITSYSEVVLSPRGADVAHRAFGSLFVETEVLPERGALLAKRRPRLLGEPEVWMVQMLAPEGGGWGALDYDSSRANFIGRHRGTDAPLALAHNEPLSKQTGRVLDPALVLRRGVRLGAGMSARLTLTTGLASSRDEAIGLIENYSAQHSFARALELGWAGVRVELRHLGISATEVHRFQRLLSAVIFPHPALRMGGVTSSTRGTAGLWAQGISGDLPIVLFRIDHVDFGELCRDLLLAHEFWRLNGFACDLVIINEEPSGYLQPTQDSVRDLVRQARIDQPGGVFLRRSDQMSDEERELITCAARVVLRASEGSLGRQLRRAATLRAMPPQLSVGAVPKLKALPVPPSPRPKLTYDNGLGGFDGDGREYVISLLPGVPTPAPWCNVMANPGFGALVSEVGSTFTWFKNSQRHRLTPWNNDAVCDPSGELVYIRDDNDGSFWSATPEPLGADSQFLVRHGQGYSTFAHTRRAITHELTISVSATDPVKFTRLRLTNVGRNSRRLSVYSVVDWVLGGSREMSRVSISSSFDPELRAVFAQNPLSLFPGHRAFFAVTGELTSVTADREEFFGVAGARQRPEALGRTRLSGVVGSGLDPCAALHVAFDLGPGQTHELTFILGQTESLESAERLVAKYPDVSSTRQALEQTKQAWEEILGTVRVKTPDRALDMLLNHWLLYQSVSSRLWGRTGFYQSSGAYGYRDQLQDVLAAIHARPDLAREHLLRCAVHQFTEGDVQHWWHDETGEGLRTRCSDDMLWLPYVTAEYVRLTGDRGVLDEALPFLNERVLAPGEEDLFSAPALSGSRASLYEHCARALDAGATEGPHGLPTMRGGDWNDGMNRVGHHGQGESVWLAWFLAKTMVEFAELARHRGDRERVTWCTQKVARLAQAVEKHGWDGHWYRRAYFDDGTPLGSRQNSECSIDAIAQSWAVIAGIGDPERAKQALRSSEERLISERHKLMQLLDPPFQQTVPDPGYIQAYPPGIRENGGQYTHGVLWTVLALTLEGEGDRASALFSHLNPIRHGDTPDTVAVYRVEPYVVAADVYGASEHAGRGGWTWYTGSAGWMYRITLENMLGVRRSGNTLTFAPCIPSSWASFEIDYRYGSSRYHIVIQNPQNLCSGAVSVELDGRAVKDGTIRLDGGGQMHEVKVTLGAPEVARLARAGSARLGGS